MRIIYGVAGEGMGHAIRSRTVIDYLSKKNEVLVACGGKAYPLLSRYFNTIETDSFHIKFSNNRVKPISTFFCNVLKLPAIPAKSITLFKKLSSFNPDIVINDFEPYTNYFAVLYKKPLITINNQHIAIKTDIDNAGGFIDRYISNCIIKIFSSFEDYSLINTFFYPKIKKRYRENTFLFPPILREEILKVKRKKGKHILIYLSTKDDGFINMLKKFKENFIIYGLNENKVQENVQMKKFNEKKFISDLASAKAVICNGGFTTIGEALHLGKPILSIPIRNHYEQFLNGYYLKKLRYGEYAEKLNEKALNHFLENLKKYKKSLSKYKRENNKRLLKKLDEIMNKI